MPILTRGNAAHLRIGGQPCGPLTKDQVKVLTGQGIVSKHDTLSVDGGKTWVFVGNTSLLKYMPTGMRKAEWGGALAQPSSVLDFSAAMRALPPDPSITRLPDPEPKAPLPPRRLPPKHAVHGRGWFMTVGVVVCIFVALYWVQLRPSRGGKDKGKAVGPDAALMPLGSIHWEHAQEEVVVAGVVGAVEGRADPAQLPGLAARCALVRLHDKGASVLCALPIRGPEGAALPNSVYAVMDDTGWIKPSDAAVLCDDHGVRMDPGSRVRLTGTVHFENKDIQQEMPVIEVTRVVRILAQAEGAVNH